jgi:cell cycle sensor histidine kinase DivJ
VPGTDRAGTMRITEARERIEERLAGLVHASVAADPTLRRLHERFIRAHMVAGTGALASLPAYLLGRGMPSPAEAAAAIFAAGPIIAAAILSLTGSLAWASAVASAAMTILLVALVLSTPSIVFPALACVLVLPLQALMWGWRATLAACGCAILGAVAIASGWDELGSAGADSGTLLGATVLAVLALWHGLGHVLAHADLRGALMSDPPGAPERTVVDAFGDLVTWHDRQGGVLKANGAAGTLLGVPSTALHGQGLLAHVHVSDRPAFLKALSDAAHGGNPAPIQLRLHRHSLCDDAASGLGSPFTPDVLWAEMNLGRADPRARGGGASAAVVAIIRDASESRRRADELEAVRAEAKQASGAKDRFLAMVSHELRTPLNAIIGFSDMLSGDAPVALDSEQVRDYGRIIRDSGHHLLEVVNALLDMSKIESGNFGFAPEAFDLARMAEECCDLMQLKVQHARVRLVRSIDADLPHILADIRACRQVLINLLSNAIKFTPPGGQVTVRLQRVRDRIVLTVEDTGIGICDSDLPRIGDPFFQSSGDYGRTHEGTGLGLSVVRGLIGLHRGSLAIESGPDAGTAVTVTLPLDCRTGAPQAPPVPVRTSVRCSPTPAARLRKSA